MTRELDLSDEQAQQMAAILDDLKTQRAQAKVDHRRARGAFADAFLKDTFDQEAVSTATKIRADSAASVQDAVAKTLERTFALLDADQRKRLAHLLRSDALTI